MTDDDFLSVMDEDMHCRLDKAKEIYSAPYARNLGIEIQHISSDSVSLYLDIRPEHINSRGFVHGAVIYGLTDHTLAFASNLDKEAVGQSTDIIYHRPVRSGRIISMSKLINESKSLAVYDIRVYSEGKLISSSVCTAFKLGEKK
jgi:uncharacterized protein (TIGR00369 family)